jgi:hypothetical protein
VTYVVRFWAKVFPIILFLKISTERYAVCKSSYMFMLVYVQEQSLLQQPLNQQKLKAVRMVRNLLATQLLQEQCSGSTEVE